MKYSEQWLREWVDPTLSSRELAEQLIMAGLEVEAVTPVAGIFNNVVIGCVLSAEQHPNADRLRVCQVDAGQKDILHIVCGAANVRAGLKVAVALIGAKLPDGFIIKEAKLRGILSQGMICAAAELGIEDGSTGIMELASDAPIGADFRHWLQLDDQIFDIHLTPNRGDCLSIQGLAREVAALNNSAFKPVAIKTITPLISEQLPVVLSAPQACPRYVGRILRAIDPGAALPGWMAERLRRAGMRCVHPVVDVSNYVMLELGQPLHAFDLAQIHGGVQVRFAQAGETLTLLDGQPIKLDEKALVIADARQAQALAGTMGGADAAVSATTTDIFIESAFFDPVTIAGHARRYGLNTDAAYRFERGVDPQLPRQALERVTELLLAIVGGKPGAITEATALEYLPKPPTIVLRNSRIKRLLGIELAPEKINAILQQLTMRVERRDADTWKVTPPDYRFDIALEEDVIEELARLHGYQQIPSAALASAGRVQSDLHPESRISLARLRRTLVERGYHEAITYSFVAPKWQQLLDPERPGLALANPISADLSVMRTTLWPGLLQAVAHNHNRQQLRVRLFETGLRFIAGQQGVEQTPVLAGVVSGGAYPEQWGMAARAVDFFDVKGDVEALLALTGSGEFSWQPTDRPALHPGQRSAICFQGKPVGHLGALHPELAEQLGLIGAIYLFELPLALLSNARLPQFRAASKFPAIRRDISFVVAAHITAQDIVRCAGATAGEWLSDVCLFDVYQGKGMPEGKRSLALGLLWRHPERTLVDAEVSAQMDQVVAALKQTFAIELRE
jgi:phenylalanyl-tRNA synthetase beta chain